MLHYLIRQEDIMNLWISAWAVLQELRSGFSRTRSFLWFTIALIGFCVRKDLAGVSSFIRALGLQGKYYNRSHISQFKIHSE
jgi:hypothetical protein